MLNTIWPHSITSPETTEAVLHDIEVNSICIGSTLNICYKVVSEILQHSLLYPYNLETVWVLVLRDLQHQNFT